MTNATTDHNWAEYWIACHSGESNPQLQVERSVSGVPISEEKWQFTLQYIHDKVDLKSTDSVLDFCAGNGLIAVPFSKQCKHVTALDISSQLVERIGASQFPNISAIVADAREAQFAEGSFDKVIFYFALQYFNEQETLLLFEKFHTWLKKDGLLFIGDIPDRERLWDFLCTKEYEEAYFGSIKEGTSFIGTWFTKSFLAKLAMYTGYTDVRVLEQPSGLLNSHYRFDLLLRK